MSVRTTTFDGVAGRVALYCSTDGIAFGPVFEHESDARDFLDHLEEIGERDPRDIPALELAQLHDEWQKETA